MSSFTTIASAVIAAALAYTPTAVLADGNDFLKSCAGAENFVAHQLTPSDTFEFGRCIGLVNGATTAMLLMNSHVANEYRNCVPKNGVQSGQGLLITMKYLRNHPEYLAQNDVGLVMLALQDAFPCR